MKQSHEASYEPLLESGGENIRSNYRWRARTSYALSALLWLSTIIALLWWTRTRVDKAKRLCGQLLYSPAQDAIEYEIRVFRQGFVPDVSEYYGPATEERNALWKDLYDLGGGQGIPRSQAVHLANQTTRLAPDRPDLYYIAIDVFHQLHCLNNIRLAMENASYYATSPFRSQLFEDNHIYHCFETLRESLMCHSDVSYVVMQWHEGRNRNVMRGDVPHTCRNFGKIRDWAREHAVHTVDWWDDHMDPDLSIDGMKQLQV